MKFPLLLTFLSIPTAFADSLLTGDSIQPTNSELSQNYGDKVSLNQAGAVVSDGGTPDIKLSWMIGKWENHSWAGSTGADGAVMQLEDSSKGGRHLIEFEPTKEDCAVSIQSFNFIGDTEGDEYKYKVSITKDADQSVAFTTDTVKWVTDHSKPFSGAPIVELDFTGVPGERYSLEILRTDGEAGALNIAIDNLRFSQSFRKLFRGSALIGWDGLTIGVMKKGN